MKDNKRIQSFKEHQELNIFGVSKSKSKSYLNEVKKQNILDDLKRIENYVSILHNMIDKSQYLDDETKQNILELKETSHQIYNQEMDKELKRQKKDGKEFLSDSDVDDLIDNQQNKKAFLVKLTDATGDVCAFLIDDETSKTIDNDSAVMMPGTGKVLDGDIDSYERWYAQTKDIMEIVKNAQDNGYFVDLNDELNFVHY